MAKTPFIDIHTHRREVSGQDFIAVQNIFANELETEEKGKYFSVGLHPWHIRKTSLEKDLQNVEEAAMQSHVIAIGETGLDRATDVSFNLQKNVFERHLDIAAKHEKPVIVHAVKAYPDIVEVYKHAGSKLKLIFHGFNENLQIARQLLDRGFFLSFGESLFNENRKSAEVFRTIPIENIFLETDESEKPIEEIYRQAAKLRKMTADKLKQQILQNFANCFGDLQ